MNIIIDPDFEDLLKQAFSTSPLSTPAMLKGRQRELERAVFGISEAGKTSFVVGDRGVGKTSLAHTCANVISHGEQRSVFEMSCEKHQELFRVVREISRELVDYDPLANPSQKSLGFKIGGIVNYESKSDSAVSIPLPESINDSLQILSSALRRWTEKTGFEVPVVIVDEFDRLEKDKELFGDFIKQIGDRSIPIRFVFCGVARELSELLSSHPSAPRHITTVLLERLSWEARQEIVTDAAKLLDLEFQSDHVFRMAAISDGYPYYIHLIGKEAARVHHYEKRPNKVVSSDDFNDAVTRAVENTMLDLKNSYDDATKKYTSRKEALATVSENELVLWAAAAHPDLERSGTAIFEDYKRLKQILVRHGKLQQDENETSEKKLRSVFNNRIQTLKKETHGQVLKSETRGWYYFNQPMLRGYCRLVAAQKTGIDLGREYH